MVQSPVPCPDYYAQVTVTGKFYGDVVVPDIEPDAVNWTPALSIEVNKGTQGRVCD
jgi:hypothetical protein